METAVDKVKTTQEESSQPVAVTHGLCLWVLEVDIHCAIDM